VSLRRKFVLVLTAFSVAIAVVFAMLMWRIASDALEAELDRRLVQIPRTVIETGGIQARDMINLAPSDTFPLNFYRARLQSLTRLVDDAFVFDATGGRDATGAVYTNYVSADPTVPIGDTLRFLGVWENEVVEALRTGASTTPVFDDPSRDPVKYGFVQVDPDSFPGVLMGVQMPAGFRGPLTSLRNALLFGAVIAGLLAVFVAGLLARNIAIPLERLSRVAIRIQRGHMDQEVGVERGDELGRLSRAMERMRRGVLERDEQLRLMLAQVAHEIRNPLGGLELFASAAAETDDVEERRHLMSRVRSEVTALNAIIDDFLAFARPIESDREAVDIREAVRGAAAFARAELGAEGIALEVDVADQPLLAVVDGDRVKRAVLNLLRNAGEAAEAQVWLRARTRGSEVEVAVADDGPGVDPALRDRIFDPFFTDKEKGAGLGLAIVRKFVEASGGRVEVGWAFESGVGSGAEFRIYFAGLEEPPLEDQEPFADA